MPSYLATKFTGQLFAGNCSIKNGLLNCYLGLYTLLTYMSCPFLSVRSTQCTLELEAKSTWK